MVDYWLAANNMHQAGSNNVCPAPVMVRQQPPILILKSFLLLPYALLLLPFLLSFVPTPLEAFSPQPPTAAAAAGGGGPPLATGASSSASASSKSASTGAEANENEMFRSGAGPTSQLMTLRVVSYNVLSSHLASPSHFTTLNPDHLDASARLPAVIKKIENEIDSNEDESAVVCLQEVSYDWAGAFHTFFANKGYHMVCGLYGKKFNGYMGCCLAWPTKSFETVDVDISRLSDEREGGWPPDEEEPALAGLWRSVVVRPLRQLGLIGDDRPNDPWTYSQRRFNVILTATLKERESGKSFCISNYHMPCAFYNPPVMTIHADMAMRHIQRIAEEKGNLPYISVGDWNIKPSESVYRLLTKGEIESDDPFYPPEKGGCCWTPSSKPVRSAYAAFAASLTTVDDGERAGEPDFTNYARIREGDPFIDTLDYIFISPAWKVASVLKLPNRVDAGGPFPNLDRGEPSDHILVASTVSLAEEDSVVQ